LFNFQAKALRRLLNSSSGEPSQGSTSILQSGADYTLLSWFVSKRVSQIERTDGEQNPAAPYSEKVTHRESKYA
jgi:homospermidine synthase